MKRLPEIARVTVSALLISAAIGKALFFPAFVEEIMRFKMVHDSIAATTGITILALEIGLGILLLIGFKKTHVTFAAIGLMVFFLATKTIAVLRGIDVGDCECFGTYLSLPLWTSFVISFVMIGLLILSRRKPCQAAKEERSVETLEYAA